MMNADAQLEEILKTNGDDHLYGQILELGHPPVIVEWQKVEGFIRAIEIAQAQADKPEGESLPTDPLGLPTVVTAQKFKEAVLDYVRPQETSSRLATSCLLCSMPEAVTVGYKLCLLNKEPWIQRIVAVGDPNMLPVARVYMPRGLRSSALDEVMPKLPGSLWG
ncbi:uncharacterized protein KRP23_5455 [Phytophthora ramorum]|uniref:uncharacterized protein n=1 Tax=Phytophthora ramorum TaxID=164328 RepID=UPI0030A174F7|nr:hypothetical protein KRP23_5455 [Phytophthora ramorum]